jgi:hypothetical protein
LRFPGGQPVLGGDLRQCVRDRNVARHVHYDNLIGRSPHARLRYMKAADVRAASDAAANLLHRSGNRCGLEGVQRLARKLRSPRSIRGRQVLQDSGSAFVKRQYLVA